jgi:hypothetical protein
MSNGFSALVLSEIKSAEMLESESVESLCKPKKCSAEINFG